MTIIDTLPVELPDVDIDAIVTTPNGIQIEAHSRKNKATCPACQQPSTRIHSQLYTPTAGSDVFGAVCVVETDRNSVPLSESKLLTADFCRTSPQSGAILRPLYPPPHHGHADNRF